MKRRVTPSRSTPSSKSRARRATLAPADRGPWRNGGEMGAHEFAAETTLSTSGGDFGFPVEAEERPEAR